MKIILTVIFVLMSLSAQVGAVILLIGLCTSIPQYMVTIPLCFLCVITFTYITALFVVEVIWDRSIDIIIENRG